MSTPNLCLPGPKLHKEKKNLLTPYIKSPTETHECVRTCAGFCLDKRRLANGSHRAPIVDQRLFASRGGDRDLPETLVFSWNAAFKTPVGASEEERGEGRGFAVREHPGVCVGGLGVPFWLPQGYFLPVFHPGKITELSPGSRTRVCFNVHLHKQRVVRRNECARKQACPWSP